MKLKLTTLAAAVALSMSCAANAGLLSKDEIKHEGDRISAEFKSAKQACDSKAGNAKDICMAEAKGNEKVAKAELDARDKGTPKAQEEAKVAKAEANYGVAKQRCDDLGGNAKDVCLKDARAAMTHAKASAEADRKATEAGKKAAEKTSDAQRQADLSSRKADYNAARERCDALAGSARDNCVNDAKARFGQ